jgi:O-methyltransferase
MIRRLMRNIRTALKAEQMLDIPPWQREIVRKVQPFTMAGYERIISTISAVDYLTAAEIPGAIVECGVWKGGQMMAAALTLQHLDSERPIYLFDTFAGMTAPSDIDQDLKGRAAKEGFDESMARPPGKRWCEATIEVVERNMASIGYPPHLVKFVVGAVEETLPAQAPDTIAYLRLDTDWYASTLHELVHLYPRVARLGVITIDDYGHWHGARQAVDEYMASAGLGCFLHRIDYTGRSFVKV